MHCELQSFTQASHLCVELHTYVLTAFLRASGPTLKKAKQQKHNTKVFAIRPVLLISPRRPA